MTETHHPAVGADIEGAPRRDGLERGGYSAASPSAHYLVPVALFFLGICSFSSPPVLFGRTIPAFAAALIGPIPIVFVFTIALSVLGWISMPQSWLMKRYLMFGALLAYLVGISALGAWDRLSLRRGLVFIIWVVVAIPGLASLLFNRKNRRALVGGFTVAAVAFAATGTTRILLGRSPFDDHDSPWVTLLGIGRNKVNVLMVVVLALLVANMGPRGMSRLRWPCIVLIAVWIVSSGGRAGLLGIIAVVLAHALLQPEAPRKLRVLFVVFTVVFVGLAPLPMIGGYTTQSSERLLAALGGERDSGDTQRELIARRAWNIGLKNPFMGIGFGRFAGAYDPVVEEAPSRWERQRVLGQGSHNSYLGLMAESGIPAALLFVGMLMAFLRRGWMQRDSADVRGATCALVGVTVTMHFDYLLDSVFLFLPVALLLGALLRPTSAVLGRAT